MTAAGAAAAATAATTAPATASTTTAATAAAASPASLAARMRELRLRRAPLRKGAARDFATLLAWAAVRRARRHDPDEPVFVELSTDGFELVTTSSGYDEQTRTSDQLTEPPPPPDPDETTVIPGSAMPEMLEAWRRVALKRFVAGTHGPVEFPLPPGASLPTPADGKVLVASNFRPTSSLPLEHQAFIAAKTAKEIVMGSVVPVRHWSEVAAIMPTFVAVHPTTGKLRIIFDGRALNRLLADPRGVVHYEEARRALTSAICATKIDIEGAYRHVRVREDQQRYLGFEVAGRIYKYTCLPFGVNWSPALFLDAIRPVVAEARSRGIRLVWYMDDFLIMADDVETLDKHCAYFLNALVDAGWLPAADKTYPYAFSAITFLGLLISYAGPLRDGPYLSVPPSKARRIRADALALLERGLCHVSSLQKLAGRLNFARIVAPQIGFLRRGLDAATSAGLKAFHGAVPVKGRLEEELRAVAHAALTLPSFTLGIEDEAARRQLGRVYSDASAVGWGAMHLHPLAPLVQMPGELAVTLELCGEDSVPRGWTVGGRFSATDCSLSSGAREVRAVSLGAAALDLRDGHITWHCDATVAVFCITAWSSKSDHVAQALSDLWDVLRSRNLTISVSHVFRDASFMPVADWLSRQGWRESQAEWAIGMADVAAICNALRARRPTADLFASERNRRCVRFCSQWFEPGAVGDAFHVSWAGEAWWAFPPASQLERFATRLTAFYRQAEALESSAPLPSSVARGGSSSPLSSPLSPLASADCPRAVPMSPHRNLSSSCSFTVVLLYPEAPGAPHSVTVADLVARHATRSLTVFSPIDAARQLIANIRLVDGEGEDAPLGPPWPIRAALFHVGPL